MAGNWIKVEHITPDKPEIVAMAAHLGIDQDAVFGKCVRMWIWADQNTITGQDLEVQDSFLDRLSYCPGFSASLRKVGWLQGRMGRLVIPNFDRHNGQSAKSRALGKDRQEETRDTRKVEAVSMFGDSADLDADKKGGRRSLIPREMRIRIYKRDGYRCCYCGWHKNDPLPLAGRMVGLRRLSLDHITPFCQGGQETEENLVTACLACNMQKGGRTLEESGMEIMFGPLSPFDNSVTNEIPDQEIEKEEKKRRARRVLANVDPGNLPPAPKDPDNLQATRQAIRGFVPPTLEEVSAYCRERGGKVDPMAWMDHYTSNGWKVGPNSMKDWKAACRTWEHRRKNGQPKPEPSSSLQPDFIFPGGAP